MIYCNLQGRLGNQLFQFGAALRAAKGNIEKIKFLIHDMVGAQYGLDKVYNLNSLPEVIDARQLKGMKNLKLISDGSNGPWRDQPQLDASMDHVDVVLRGYFQSSKNAIALRRFTFSTALNQIFLLRSIGISDAGKKILKVH